jgi:hypothetical protein
VTVQGLDHRFALRVGGAPAAPFGQLLGHGPYSRYHSGLTYKASWERLCRMRRQTVTSSSFVIS